MPIERYLDADSGPLDKRIDRDVPVVADANES